MFFLSNIACWRTCRHASCPLILSLIMAFLKSSILIIWDEVDGCCYQSTSRQNDEQEVLQGNSDRSILCLCDFCCWVFGLSGILNEIVYHWSIFSGHCTLSCAQWQLQACGRPAGWAVREVLSTVNPTPTIIRAQCHMKVCTKLTGLTMCTHAADAPCLGSLLYLTPYGASQAHSQRLAV